MFVEHPSRSTSHNRTKKSHVARSDETYSSALIGPMTSRSRGKVPLVYLSTSRRASRAPLSTRAESSVRVGPPIAGVGSLGRKYNCQVRLQLSAQVSAAIGCK